MNAEIFAALAQLEKERGIPQQYMIDKITQALVAAYKKDKEGYTDNVFVEVEDGDLKMYVQKEVVDDVLTPATEISLDAARKINKHAELGDLVNVDVRTQNFGRIAAQTAKQVIIQGIREAERGMIFDTFSSKEHEILTGTVLRIAPDSGDMTIRLGGNTNDRTDAMLAASEQVKGESYREGEAMLAEMSADIEYRRRCDADCAALASEPYWQKVMLACLRDKGKVILFSDGDVDTDQLEAFVEGRSEAMGRFVRLTTVGAAGTRAELSEEGEDALRDHPELLQGVNWGTFSPIDHEFAHDPGSSPFTVTCQGMQWLVNVDL